MITMVESDHGFRVRPNPSDEVQRLMASGAYNPHWPNPGLGWWANGALVVDDAGAALIDADGNRRAFPSGATKLCSVEELMFGPSSTYNLFLADSDNRVLLDLPSVSDGWDEADLKELAGRAGLEFEACWLDIADSHSIFQRSLRTPSWRNAVHDRAQGERSLQSRVRRGSGIGSGRKRGRGPQGQPGGKT